MKNLAVLSVVLSFAVAALAEEPAKIMEGTGHPCVVADYSNGKVCILSADGKIEWEYPAPSCNDLWVLPSGNLLFVTGHGVKEVTRDKKVVFEWKGTPVKSVHKEKDGTTKEVENPSEIYACQRLADGNTFIGECSSGRLLEVSPDGKIVKDVRTLPEGKDGGHAYIRNARKLANGNYLVACYGGKAVKEYDASAKVVWECPVAAGVHSCIRLPNGNTLIATGDSGKPIGIIEVDKEGKTVWSVTGDELPGVSMKFMTGLQRLPNGNTVFTNWLGHGNLGKTAHVCEVTPDKKVLWTFFDHKNFKTISSIQLLDVPGDVTKGEILH
ncbi:MAG TPA: hypothetical protein VGP72_07845 [Planctomycetota bacterium]|jgi:outer membrane protein assembly factor BamB